VVLVPITEGNVDAYVAFLVDHADADGRAYMGKVDVRGTVLRRRQDHFCLRNGRPLAGLTASRTLKHDGGLIVTLTIVPEGDRDEALLVCLAEFMAGEATIDPVRTRCYRLVCNPKLTLPEAELADLGFMPRPGTYKYLRDPGPPRPGEFPGADKARAAGYVTRLATPAMAADPALFARLADIFNRGFAGRNGIRPRGAEEMRERLTAPGHGFLVALKEGEVTGYLAFTPLERDVLVGEYASLRRHWGTGSVDLMCRHVATHVAEQWGLPIIGYSETTNAPSCAAMERAGMRRVAEYPVWEYRVEVDATLQFHVKEGQA